MLRDSPEMLKIYPGIENKLLKGAIDCYIHAFPGFVFRSQDMYRQRFRPGPAHGQH